MEEEDKKVEVTYKFFLPDNQYELNLMQKSFPFYRALHDIDNECRRILKHAENPSEDLIKFAEEIRQMCYESGMNEIE